MFACAIVVLLVGMAVEEVPTRSPYGLISSWLLLVFVVHKGKVKRWKDAETST